MQTLRMLYATSELRKTGIDTDVAGLLYGDELEASVFAS